MCTNHLHPSGLFSKGLLTLEPKPADQSPKTEKSQGFFSRIYVFFKRIFFGNNYKTLTPIKVDTVKDQLQKFYHKSIVDAVFEELELANKEDITLKEPVAS